MCVGDSSYKSLSVYVNTSVTLSQGESGHTNGNIGFYLIQLS